MYNIRYKTSAEGHFISGLYLMNNVQGFVCILPKEFKFQIKGITNDEQAYLIYEETCKDLKTCKLNARKKLIELGVVFG